MMLLSTEGYHQMTTFSREFLLNEISDLSKEAYGFRFRLNYDAMTDAELQATWDGFIETAQRAAEEERQAEIVFQAKWEAHIAALMDDHGIDHATALAWDMDAMDCKDDVGFYCFRWGIKYNNEHPIKKVLGA